MEGKYACAANMIERESDIPGKQITLNLTSKGISEVENEIESSWARLK